MKLKEKLDKCMSVNMKVGDYVRTRDGRIDKIESIHNGLYVLENFPYSYNEHWLIKSSPNIIDLIEVGDYVNGSKVVRIEEHNEELYIYVQETEYCNACDEEENIYYKEDTIKSIVTKEQFESKEYKL